MNLLILSMALMGMGMIAAAPAPVPVPVPVAAPGPNPTPVQIVYTGESCDCPQKLGYQLNVPNTYKPKKPTYSQYGYRVEKPVQAKAKISYSFDFTVEEPRTPAPPKVNPSKLYAKVDRVTVNKPDCGAKRTGGCSCSSCSSRYVSSPSLASPSPNAIRRRRDLRRKGLPLPERPTRYIKLYHKDLAQEKHQQQISKFPTFPSFVHGKRKTKKALINWKPLSTSRRHLTKRDIKGEFDLLEREREQIDYHAPEIIQFMPETLNPNYKPMPCHMGCGVIEAAAPPAAPAPPLEVTATSSSANEMDPKDNNEDAAETPPHIINSINTKRAAAPYFPQHLQSPLRPILPHYQQQGYKYVDDTHLSTLLSTTSVPDPLEQSSTPLQFVGDLEGPGRGRGRERGPYDSLGAIEHVADAQLDSIIKGLLHQHPTYSYDNQFGDLVDPEPVQKKQTTDFLKKLIDGRLGGWGFGDEAVTTIEPEQLLQTDYANSERPTKTYGYNSHAQNGYNVDTYNAPPITDYLRAWF
ncbi:uncharacterized protein Cp7Fb [Drosophila tropicalis]|uniref:uncharacterized protein Cp7Fb n=1 Tax=Drosophila tropicalis TaxID=46794 RepID=UPI0035ABC31D